MHQYGSPEDQNALQQYFYQIDTDRSGSIDARELEQALRLAGERCDPEYVGMLLRMHGKQAGGSLSFHDFTNVVGFMRQNKQQFQSSTNGQATMDLAAVQRSVAETHRGFGGLDTMMPMVTTMFNSMGGQQGGITMDKFQMIMTFVSTIRNFMGAGGGGGSAGGIGALLGGMGGLGGLGAALGGGGGFGGAPSGGASTQSYASSSTSAPSYGGSSTSAAPSYGSGGGSSHGSGSSSYGGASSAPSGGAGVGAGGMNSILDQIMGANLGSGASTGSSGGYGGASGGQTSYGGSSGGQAGGYGGSSGGYGGAQAGGYGGASVQAGGYGGQQGGQAAGSAALNGFKPPTGYGTAPASNAPAGPAFTGVE